MLLFYLVMVGKWWVLYKINTFKRIFRAQANLRRKLVGAAFLQIANFAVLHKLQNRQILRIKINKTIYFFYKSLRRFVQKSCINKGFPSGKPLFK